MKQRSTRLLGIVCRLTTLFVSHCALFGQQAIYVNDGHNVLRLLRKVVDDERYYYDKGKFRAVEPGGDRPLTAVRPADEFLPVFVSIPKVSAKFMPSRSERGKPMDHTFEIALTLSSNVELKHPFIAFEFETDRGAKRPYIRELSTEALMQSKTLFFEGTLPDDLPSEKYEIHIFSEGVEVLNSQMSRASIESALSKMVAKRIKDTREAQPKPLTGPMPRYPESLRKSKVTGHAVVTCLIAPTGQPLEVTLKNTTDPVFGEAALAVMPQWWFLPKVENGRAVTSKAELPFDFAPPKS